MKRYISRLHVIQDMLAERGRSGHVGLEVELASWPEQQQDVDDFMAVI